MPNTKLTVGLLIHDLAGAYQEAVWQGTLSAAQAAEANVLCFSGGELKSPYGFHAQRNGIYDLVGADNVACLVILTGALGNYVTTAELLRFCERYRPLPLVSLADDRLGLPAVVVDDGGGMEAAIEHLLVVHGYRRIAFLGGPRGNADAERRYAAYINVLARYGLPVDTNLVAVGNFRADVGAEAVGAMCDRRHVKFEALVAANDAMALGALAALQARGRRVPEEIAVVGFDDIEETHFSAPPLTSVRQPLRLQAQRAVEMALALARGETPPSRVVLPTQLIVRRSCGCIWPEALRLTTSMAEKAVSPEFGGGAHSAASLSLPTLVALQGMEGATRLWKAWVAELRGEKYAFQTALWNAVATGGETSVWRVAVTELYHQGTTEAFSPERLEAVWSQAQWVIGEAAAHAQAHKRLQREQEARCLHLINEALSSVASWAELRQVWGRYWASLGIHSAHLVLHSGEQPEGRLVAAYAADALVALPDEGVMFPASCLAPSTVWPPAQRYSAVMQALFFRERPLGWALFAGEAQWGLIYENLREQLNNVLPRLLIHPDLKFA